MWQRRLQTTLSESFNQNNQETALLLSKLPISTRFIINRQRFSLWWTYRFRTSRTLVALIVPILAAMCETRAGHDDYRSKTISFDSAVN